MPLTPKGRKILHNMQQEYGAAKGKAVFYASINKGLIEGAEAVPTPAGRKAAIRKTPRRRKARN